MSKDIQKTIAQNLLQRRKERRWSQEKLATAAGLSRQAYVAIETCKAEPRAETLYDLADALEIKIEELLVPVPSLVGARFRSYKRLRTRSQIRADVAKRLHEYNFLEEALSDRVSYVYADFCAPDFQDSAERSIRAAALARSVLELEKDEPIRDICGLLEAAGIKILAQSVASEDFFGLSVSARGGGPAIVVNTWDRISVERWIFTAAHELGHLLLHSSAYDDAQTKENDDEESDANIFASHFLMPETVFCKEWNEASGLPLLERVYKVKRMFRVSYKTVLYRLSKYPGIGTAIWPRFYKTYSVINQKSLRKTDEPFSLSATEFRNSFPEASRAGEPETLSPADFFEDRLYSLVRRGVEEGKVSLSKGADILNINLEKMRSLCTTWVGDADADKNSCK